MKTSRLHALRLGAAALLAIAATSVFAQDQGGPGGPPPGGPGGFGGPRGMRMGPPPAIDRLPPLAHVVDRPEVAAEINLTEDQRDKIDEIIQTMRPQGGPGGPGGPDGFGGPQDGPPQGGPGGRRGPEDRAARDKAEAALDAKIKAVLTADQVKRVTQIQIQMMGLSAAMVPSVQTKLGLTEDQKAKLKALMPARPEGGRGPGGFGQGGPGGPPPQGGDDRNGPPPGGPGGPDGFGGPPQGGPGGGRGMRGGPDGDPRRKALETKIAAILTDDQKALLKSLGGKVINLRQGPPPPQG